MKKLIFSLSLLLICSLSFAQKKETRTDANGNYIEVSATKAEPKNTGKTYTDKTGKIYPVWEGAKGGRYIIRTSKAGKDYKQYL